MGSMNIQIRTGPKYEYSYNLANLCENWAQTKKIAKRTHSPIYNYVQISGYMGVGSDIATSSVCKACSQKIEKLLKFESNVSSILSMLKASIQALALTATTQAPLLSEQREHQSTFSTAFRASGIGR